MALVRDPRTGLMVEVPDSSPAAALQAAAAQPVIGPRSQVGATPAPVAPAARLTPQALDTGRIAPGAFDVTPGITDFLSSQPSTVGPTVRFGVQPPPAAPAQSALVPRFQLNTPAPVPTPAAAASPPNAASAEINAQTQQLAEFRRQTNALQTQAMERQNQLMADRALTRGEQAAPAPIPGVRGDYNLANTSTVDAAGNITSTLRQPVGAGLTFGFGENGAPTAREVLDRFSAQDQAARDRAQIRVAEARQRADLSRLRDLEKDPVAYRRALQTLQVTAPQLVGAQDRAAESATSNAKIGAELTLGNQRTEAALLQQLLANQAQVEAASIAGQASIGAQQARAQQAVGLELLKAQSPQGQKAAAQARLAELQLALALGALADRDTQTALAAATGGRPPQARVATDAVGIPRGVYDAAGNFTPYSPDQLDEIRAAFGSTLGE